MNCPFCDSHLWTTQTVATSDGKANAVSVQCATCHATGPIVLSTDLTITGRLAARAEAVRVWCDRPVKLSVVGGTG